MTFTATLNFSNRSMAQEFATRWAFYSKTGYTLGAGNKDVKVTLHNVSEENKSWINSQVNKLNEV